MEQPRSASIHESAALKLNPHPRLYIRPEHWAELERKTDLPLLAAAQDVARQRAAHALEHLEVEIDRTANNWHLLRARGVQGNVVSLLLEYKRSGERRFRDAILRNIEAMGEWEHWAWNRWRANDPRPEAFFDLSYGENSATLALAFDQLRTELTDAEIDRIVAVARRRALQPYLVRVDCAQPEFWYMRPDSNWNTVCNGGAGMLALALYEFCPEAPRVLPLVERGIVPYFESLQKDGAWPEGIGYWNYGMRYGFMYLLSHEAATGNKHPLLERKQTEASLEFPLAFSPHGIPCSFGDANKFFPMPFHYAMAERYGRWDIVQELDQRPVDSRFSPQGRADAAELLLLHPRSRAKAPAPAIGSRWANTALIKGLEWGYIADRMPRPGIYVSVRGGTTRAPHTHDDLLSFFCVVNDEALIDNVPAAEYYDTTFGSRRFELYETRTDSKNTLFINGIGSIRDGTVAAEIVECENIRGIRLDATQAMGTSGGSAAAASFCARAILLVKDSAVLVIDRIEATHVSLMESRLHTFSAVEIDKLSAAIRGKRNSLHLAFAATQPAMLRRGMGTPTSPNSQADTMIRFCSAARCKHITLATLLTPNGVGTLALEEMPEKTALTIGGHLEARVEFRQSGLRI